NQQGASSQKSLWTPPFLVNGTDGRDLLVEQIEALQILNEQLFQNRLVNGSRSVVGGNSSNTSNIRTNQQEAYLKDVTHEDLTHVFSTTYVVTRENSLPLYRATPRVRVPHSRITWRLDLDVLAESWNISRRVIENASSASEPGFAG